MRRRMECSLMCLFLLGCPVFADTASKTGVVRGTIVTVDTGSEKLAVAGAQVKLSGGESFEVQADATGVYTFTAVPAGEYRIVASAPGLSGSAGVQVVAGQTVDAEVQLQIEAFTASVTVTSEANPLASSDPGARDVISEALLNSAPNKNERIDGALPLIPGVVRGPDGLINIKGARTTQNGSLVNGANASDPVTGNAAIRLPIDVVSSVQVIANPYDPEYGKLAGAVATVDTRTSSYEGFHASIQNLLPRPRKRAGDFVGIEAATPRATITGPILKDKLAFTQSLEYRFVRTPVPGLPQLQRDIKLESFDSYSQADWTISKTQSATVSLSMYPQKIDYLGLNTFTPQPATPDLHQHGYMASAQHRLVTGEDSLLVSQFSFKRLDADVTAQSDEPYRLLIETTQGGFFNRQHRETYRDEWQETYHFGHFTFHGSHEVKAGFNYVHSSYDGQETFLPAEIIGRSGASIQRIDFAPASQFSVGQDETAWFVSDKWTVTPRLTADYGLRLDHDSITGATNSAPRAGISLALTRDSKTLIKAGGGIFYDRVVLNVPAFALLPDRTVTTAAAKAAYTNTLSDHLQNPRSASWNVELDRQVLERLIMRVGYQQRNTSRDFIVTPLMESSGSVLSVGNGGLNIYREFQITGRYKLQKHIVNASYVRSKAYGDLNDFNQFFGDTPQVVIQPDQRARLPFDAPNRYLFCGEFAAPGKITFSPYIELHSGFPYSLVNQEREFVGARNAQRYPGFASVDAQVTRTVAMPLIGKAKVGLSVFNLLNHFNPRDTQNNIDSERFGSYFNGVGRTFRGKFVVEF